MVDFMEVDDIEEELSETEGKGVFCCAIKIDVNAVYFDMYGDAVEEMVGKLNDLFENDNLVVVSGYEHDQRFLVQRDAILETIPDLSYSTVYSELPADLQDVIYADDEDDVVDMDGLRDAIGEHEASDGNIWLVVPELD